MRKHILLGLFITMVAFAGCGASKETLESADRCFKKCDLDSMVCLESSRCLDANGQHIPCEEECEEKRYECEQAC